MGFLFIFCYVNSAMNFDVYRTTIRGTTNAGGNISLNTDGLERKVWLLNAYCNERFAVSTYYANNSWGCKLIDSTADAKIVVIASTNVTIQCLWMRLR